MQKAAEAAVATTLDELEQRRQASLKARKRTVAPDESPLQAAVVAIDPRSGAVRALVGGRSFADSRFNRAMQAKRQPGSAFKTFVYAAALESGYTPATLIEDLDAPIDTLQGAYTPEDGHSDAAEMTMRAALKTSSNRAAVRMLEMIGAPAAVSYAGKLGMAGLPAVPSLALGSGEVTLFDMTSAYGAFAAEGLWHKPSLVRRVEDLDGTVLFTAEDIAAQAVRPDTAFLMTSMLQDVIDGGTAWKARQLGFKLPAAGKTGTTNEYRDAWFVGYTKSLVSGVWVGYDTPRPILPGAAYAADVAVPLWARFMTPATANDEPEPFKAPRGVVGVQICRLSGKRPAGGCDAVPVTLDDGGHTEQSMVRTEYFAAGTEPSKTCPSARRQVAARPLRRLAGRSGRADRPRIRRRRRRRRTRGRRRRAAGAAGIRRRPRRPRRRRSAASGAGSSDAATTRSKRRKTRPRGGSGKGVDAVSGSRRASPSHVAAAARRLPRHRAADAAAGRAGRRGQVARWPARSPRRSTARRPSTAMPAAPAARATASVATCTSTSSRSSPTTAARSRSTSCATCSRSCGYRPFEGQRRVVLIRDADALNDDGPERAAEVARRAAAGDRLRADLGGAGFAAPHRALAHHAAHLRTPAGGRHRADPGARPRPGGGRGPALGDAGRRQPRRGAGHGVERAGRHARRRGDAAARRRRRRPDGPARHRQGGGRREEARTHAAADAGAAAHGVVARARRLGAARRRRPAAARQRRLRRHARPARPHPAAGCRPPGVCHPRPRPHRPRAQRRPQARRRVDLRRDYAASRDRSCYP